MIQEFLIRYVLSPIAGVYEKVNDRIRNFVFVVAGVLLFMQYVFKDLWFSQVPYFLAFAFGCGCIGLMTLSMMKPNMKPIAFHKGMGVCWFGTGILILVSGLRFNIDWISDAAMFLVVCPAVFLVWANVEYERIMALLSRVCILSFVIYLIPSMLMIPIEDQQYAGLFCNVNGTALYLIVVFACLLVETLRPQIKKWMLSVYLILLGICFALIFYTNSRTGQMAAILCFLAVGGICFVRDRKQWGKRVLIRLALVLAAVGVMLPLTVYLFQGGNLIGQALFSAAASESQSSGIGSFLEYNNVKMELATQGVETMSAGRVSIWKAYLAHSKLFGNGMPERFWIEGRNAFYSTAHMTLITFIFRHGYVCGLLFGVFVALSGLKSIQFAYQHKGEAYALFPLAVSVVYFVATMLASVNTPFYYIVTIYYYLVQTTLMVGLKKGQDYDQKIVS